MPYSGGLRIADGISERNVGGSTKDSYKDPSFTYYPPSFPFPCFFRAS